MPDPEIRSPLPIARSLDAGSARSERRLLRVQAISGSIFLLFTLVHLANTGIAALGVEAYSDYQHAARRFYQHPLGELGLMAAPWSSMRERPSRAFGGAACAGATDACAVVSIGSPAISCSS